MTSLRILFSNIYKLCECGCGILIPFINSRGLPARFKIFHSANLKGIKNLKYKGMSKSNNYNMITVPDYYKADKRGRVYEHIYNFEQYHKCCILKWGEVHHIIPVNKGGSNLPYNLQGMMKSKHLSLHHRGNRYRRGRHIDISDRRCHICKSNETHLKKPSKIYSNKTPYPVWHHLPWDKINWYCNKCRYKEIRKKKIILV